MGKENIFKIFKAAIIAAAAMLVMSGCGESGCAEVQHIAVAISNTKNEPNHDLGLLKLKISDFSMASGSTLSYFNMDGDPEYMDTVTIPKYKTGISPAKKKQLSNGYADQIMTELAGLPDDEELDVFKGICLASRQLQEYDGAKALYVVSSGLSTTGLVDFTNLYLEKDHSREVVEALKNELPNLKGVSIVWFGLGQTSGEQTDLYESNIAILENTWKNVLIACGVNEEDITFCKALAVDSDSDKKSSEQFLYVSEVPISQPLSIVSQEGVGLESEQEDDENNNKNKVLNLSDKISFKPDSVEFLTSTEEVAESLKPIIDYLKQDKRRQILIIGTTSSWGEDENSLREFSYKRCEHIKRVFLEKGIFNEQIVCIGAGYDNSLTENDRADDNSLIEEIASKNRAVYVYTNAKSPAGKKILEQFSGQQ